MRFLRYDTIDSTNEAAKRLLNAGEISNAPLGNPVCLLANAQSAGKGTQGRYWASPQGAGLYLSIVHTTDTNQPLTLTHHYTQAAGIACIQTFFQLFGLNIQLKPINDLYAICPQTQRYKKLGGILVESLLHDNQLKAIITGIGINILAVERTLSGENVHPDIVPITLEELLDSPKLAQVRHPEQREEWIMTLVQQIDVAYAQINREPLEKLEAAYQAVCLDPALLTMQKAGR